MKIEMVYSNCMMLIVKNELKDNVVNDDDRLILSSVVAEKKRPKTKPRS